MHAYLHYILIDTVHYSSVTLHLVNMKLIYKKGYVFIQTSTGNWDIDTMFEDVLLCTVAPIWIVTREARGW